MQIGKTFHETGEARARTVDEKLQTRIIAELWKLTRAQ